MRLKIPQDFSRIETFLFICGIFAYSKLGRGERSEHITGLFDWWSPAYFDILMSAAIE